MERQATAEEAWAHLLTDTAGERPSSEQFALANQFLADCSRRDVEPEFYRFAWHPGTGPRVRELDAADPLYFSKRVLGIKHITSAQLEIIKATRKPGQQYITVGSGHNVGKSFIGAERIAWFMLFHRDSEALVSAVKVEQVKRQIWSELARMRVNAKVPLGGEFLATEWRLGEKWRAYINVPKHPEGVQGPHAEDVLILTDESAGVPDGTDEAMEGSMGSPHAVRLAFGNPTKPVGWFAKSLRSSSDWSRIFISCLDHPNILHQRDVYDRLAKRKKKPVRKLTAKEREAALKKEPLPIPRAVTLEWCERAKRRFSKWMYRSRVLGQVPDESTLTIVSMADANHLLEVDRVPVCAGARWLAMDVALDGEDVSTVYIGASDPNGEPVLLYIEEIGDLPRGDKGTFLAGWATDIARQWDIPRTSGRFIFDADGVGVTVRDALVRMNWNFEEFHGGQSPMRDDMYINQRAEAWFHCAQVLEQRRLAVAESVDREILELCSGQLPTVQKHWGAKDGRLGAESKIKMRARGEKSPDHGDALVYLLYRLVTGGDTTAYQGYDAGRIVTTEKSKFDRGGIGSAIDEGW